MLFLRLRGCFELRREQLVSAQGEIEHLRAEIQRRTQLKNPLPAPPQPISLDRYAGFGQANGSQSWFNDNGRSMLPPARTQTSLGVSYVHPRNLYGDDDRENQVRVLGDSNGLRKDRKGKSRERLDTTSVYGSVPPPYLPPHETSKPKVGIIPGASPKSKFVPPDPDAEFERGLHAFKPPDHEARLNAHHRPFDPARDIVDPYSVIAATLPEYANGFAEGYSNGFQAIHKPLASGSGTRDSDPDAGGSGSDRDRRERRRRRRDEERERERRERDPDRERREHRSRRERPRDGERASTSHRPRGDTGSEDAGTPSHPPSSSRSHREGEHRTSSRAHRGDRPNPEPRRSESAALAMLSDDPPQRRRTMSRSQTTGSVHPQPVIAQPTPAPPTLQQGLMRPNSTAPPLAQPTPRIPVQIQHLESLEESTADEMPTPASRRSIQSISTVESWGTVSSLAPPSPNSFISLNLRSLPRPGPMPVNEAPFESPARHTLPPAPSSSDPPTTDLTSGDEDDEDEEDEDTEVEDEPTRQPHHPPPAFPSTRTNESSRPTTRNSARAHTDSTIPREQSWGPHPISAPVQAPGHGSRHTQAISIPETQQASSMPYLPLQLPPPSGVQSAGAAIPETHSRHSRNHSSSSSRRDAHQHRSRHSASQVPTMSSERSSGHRPRRTSLASVPTLNQASLSSLSLGSSDSASIAQAPASAPITESQWDNDAGYHTDVPSSGNALGLAISLVDRDYTIRNRTSGVLPISQPKPVPAGQTNFLRSLSRDNYGTDE